MKQIILGLLFVIGMMGEGLAQERSTTVNRVYDFVGTIDKNTKILELNNLSQQIKDTKDWDVIMTSVAQPSQYVIFNNIQFVKGTKRVVIHIPEEKNDKPQILVSKDLENELPKELIDRILKVTLNPVLEKNGKVEAFKAVLAELMANQVLFSRNSQQKRGFDDNDVKGYSSHIADPRLTIPTPWKSLKDNESDLLNVQFSGLKGFNDPKVAISGNNLNLLTTAFVPIQNSPNTYQVATSGATFPDYITYKTKSPNPSNLNIISYPEKKNHSILYYVVDSKKHSTTNKQIITNISDAELGNITSETNKQFATAAVSFNVPKTVRLEIDFDKNGDEIFEGGIGDNATFEREFLVLRDEIKKHPLYNSYESVLVFVNNPGHFNPNFDYRLYLNTDTGITDKNTITNKPDKISFIFPSNHVGWDNQSRFDIGYVKCKM